MRPLLPTLKERKRYIAFRVLADTAVAREACTHAIMQSVRGLFGEMGAARMGPMVLRYRGNSGLLRVAHDRVDHARAALAFTSVAGDVPCTIQSIQASGVLARANEAR